MWQVKLLVRPWNQAAFENIFANSLLQRICVFYTRWNRILSFFQQIGDGTLNDNKDNVEIPIECIAPETNDIVEDIYGDIIRQGCFDELADSAILEMLMLMKSITKF